MVEMASFLYMLVARMEKDSVYSVGYERGILGFVPLRDNSLSVAGAYVKDS